MTTRVYVSGYLDVEEDSEKALDTAYEFLGLFEEHAGAIELAVAHDRRVVCFPFVVTLDNGRGEDRLAVGDQFEVLKTVADQVWIERGLFTGWISQESLRQHTTEMPPI